MTTGIGRAGDHGQGLWLPPPGQERLPRHARRRVRRQGFRPPRRAAHRPAHRGPGRRRRQEEGRPASSRRSRINGRPVARVHRHRPVQRDDRRRPAPATEARDPRRPDGDAGAGPDLPGGQGPARADRRPAAHRGKTILLQQIANAITTNNPEVHADHPAGRRAARRKSPTSSASAPRPRSSPPTTTRKSPTTSASPSSPSSGPSAWPSSARTS